VSDCAQSGNRLSFFVSLSLLLFLAFFFIAIKRIKNLKKEKARIIPQATVMASVSSHFEKRNRMIRFYSTFFSLPACTHLRKFFFAQQNENEHFDSVRQSVYQKLSHSLQKKDKKIDANWYTVVLSTSK
jgi:hypothetical protein